MKITEVELTQWLLSLNSEQKKVAIELIKEIGGYTSALSLTDSDVMDILTPYLEDESEIQVKSMSFYGKPDLNGEYPEFLSSYP